MESPDDLIPPAEPTPALVDPTPTPVGIRFVSLIADDGREPPSTITEAEALGAWSAASCPWHPALLAHAADLPRFEDVALPTDPESGEIRLVAAGQMARLPADYRAQAEAAGVPLVEATADRLATVQAVCAAIPSLRPDVAPLPSPEGIGFDSLAEDYLALGTLHWWTRDLTIALGHVDTLARPALLREGQSGALAYLAGDRSKAENHVRAAFELLSEARERFYPMDAYLLDFVLLDRASPPEGVAALLDAGHPFTLIATGEAVEAFATARPDLAERLREAIDGGWADVVGGTWSEADEPFLPWTSLSWQYRRGSQAYRAHLGDRNVEGVARRRFALYPQLPQVAHRFGARNGYLVALDAGRFPVVPESKRQWASPDGTSIESLTRPPVAGNRAVEAVRLAWRLGKSMRDDGAATLPIARWPEPVAGWFADLRRSARFGTVLARWITAHDYFLYSDRPFEEVTLRPDDLATPYLAQAVARRDPSPISHRQTHARRRALYDALEAIHALGVCLTNAEREPIPPDLQRPIELDLAADEGESALVGVHYILLLHLAHALSGDRGNDAAALGGDPLPHAPSGAGGSSTPGYLVFNPLGIPRRTTIWFQGGPPLANDGKALKALGPRPVGSGSTGVVELAPFGFAWFAEDTRTPAGSLAAFGSVTVAAKTLTMSHDSIIVVVDPATGGIRGINGVGEESPRLAQQLLIHGLTGPDGQPAPSRMRAVQVQVIQAGPAVGQIQSQGTIHHPHDDRVLAWFVQRVTILSGRPGLSIEIRLSDLDPTWLASIGADGVDPWGHYLACRWAWADGQSTLRRSSLLHMTPTEAERPETPDAIDITSRQRRTTLHFGGLAYHRRHGPRMLDTLLVVGQEVERAFKLGVTLNMEHAFPAILDFHHDAEAIRTDAGPPASGPVGWLIRVDSRAVAIVRLVYSAETNDGEGWGIVADLIETAGRPTRCRLLTFRPPTYARQVNGHGDHVAFLTWDDDGVSIDLTGHEIARVEVTFASHASPTVAESQPLPPD